MRLSRSLLSRLDDVFVGGDSGDAEVARLMELGLRSAIRRMSSASITWPSPRYAEFQRAAKAKLSDAVGKRQP